MPRSVDTIVGPFTFNRAQMFRRVWQKAVADGKHEFRFENAPFVTDFAGQLVEFLMQHFDLESEDEPD